MTIVKEINLDMDGTFVDLYGVEGWLDDLINHNPRPYAEALPLVNFSALARILNRLQRNGYKINIISWLAKNSTAEFDLEVTRIKKEYLAKRLPSVHFDNITILPYGTPKQMFGCGYLFDDEEHNRNEWGEGAFNVKDLINTLKMLDK